LEKSGGGEQQPVGAVVLYDLGAQSVCSNFIARIKIEDDYSSVFLYIYTSIYTNLVLTSDQLNKIQEYKI